MIDTRGRRFIMSENDGKKHGALSDGYVDEEIDFVEPI